MFLYFTKVVIKQLSKAHSFPVLLLMANIHLDIGKRCEAAEAQTVSNYSIADYVRRLLFLCVRSKRGC